MTDEVELAEWEADEFDDATKLSPREYAQARGISAQLVYYHIRQGHFDKEKCVCGRSVIDIEKADNYLRKAGKIK